tara:strand:+ start:1754 stop:2794 length:1041 start_codon:yes stop_codon:yes gene_type:complete
MAITLSGISNDILSTTIYEIADEVSEGLFETTPFLSVARKLGKVQTFDGGYKLVVPIETKEHSQVTVLDSGWEALDLSVQDFTEQAEYDWTRLAMPVLISGREEAENSGDRAIIDLAEARFKNAMSALMRQVNQQIVRGGTAFGSSMASLNGNGGSTFGAGVTTGFLEANAVGSQTNGLGGLTRGSVPGINNQFTNAGGTLTLAQMYELEAQASTLLPAGGDGGRFHLTLASLAAYSKYRQLLQNNERYVDATTLDASGVSSIRFSSGVIMPERQMDVGAGGAGANSLMMLNLDGIKLYTHRGADFEFTGFENISGYDGRYGRILFMGGLTANHIGSSALLTNGEA